VRAIVKGVDGLVEWLGAFHGHVLTPIRNNKRVLACFVARLKASRYELDQERIGQLRPGSAKPCQLYSCNCGTFIHYCLCKHCVARGMYDGSITDSREA
jgi:hypothetical protein